MATKFLKLLAVLLLVSLALEVGLFNIKHWETLGNSETGVALTQSNDGTRVVYHAEFDNAKVNAIAFDLDYTADDAVGVTVSVSDSGNSAEEYDLPQVTYYSSGRKYLLVDANGYLKSLSITIQPPDYGTLSVSDLGINPQIPFNFQVKRFVLVFFILLIIALLWPRSFVWETKLADRSIASRVVSIGALAVALAFSLMAFAGPTDDSNSPWYNTFAYNEYAQLAHSFAKGEVYLEEEPPAWMQDMDGLSAGEDRLTGDNNVYDVSQREDLGNESGAWCKDDAAYYNGHYYVYFGVVPVVLLYLPFYLLTGMDLPDSAAALIAILLFVVLSWFLLREICAQRFSRASVGVFVACYATLLCASGIVITLSRPQFYNVPVVYALMFAVLGLLLLAKGYRKNGVTSCALLFFGALSIACIAGCRPQLLMIGAALLWIGYKIVRQKDVHLGGAKIACLCVPVVLLAVAIMGYNFVRFGSVFDFGANYNLAGNDMTLRDFSVVRAVEGIVYYLFSTPHVTTAFPFFQAFFPDSTYMSVNMTEPVVMGVFIACPILFSIVYYLVTSRKSTLWLSVAWLALSGVVIAAFDANAAGVLGRYGQDCGVFFGLAAAFVLLDVDARGGLSGFVKALTSSLIIVMMLFAITTRLSLMAPSSTPTGPRVSTAMIKEVQPLFEFWR